MKEFTRSCSHILNNMLCTSSLVVQFSKINAAHFVPQPVRCSTVPCCAVSLRQPIYYTTFFSVCQGVFQKFFEVFSELHFSLWFDSPTSQEAVSFCSLVLGARLLYHFSFRLSRGFPKVFSDFFSSVFWKPFLLSVGLDFSWVLFSSACIVYHFFPLLSTPFRNFLWFFLFYSISQDRKSVV